MHGPMNVKSRHMFHEGTAEYRSHLPARHTSTQPGTCRRDMSWCIVLHQKHMCT